jgi:iron-sulfur cluster assembly protein
MITVTDQAKNQAIRLMEEDDKSGYFIRVGVQGGGCSGMSYGFTLDEIMNEDDFEIPIES